MATRAVSKTVNPGSNPGSPVSGPTPASRNFAAGRGLFWVRVGRGAHSSKGTNMRRNSGVRAIVAALAATAVMVAIVGIAQARPPGSATGGGAAADPCPGSDEVVSEATLPDLRKSVRCLISVERVARGLPKLDRAESLETAAKRHVRTMIDTDCLAHRCPGEVDLEHRLRRAGYLDGITTYRFAESTGCGTTAESMVSSWMASVFDRTNVLDVGFKDIGVAVSQDASDELCGDGYGTFAVVFGSRIP
jgi:uncharacterized protein YkwD